MWHWHGILALPFIHLSLSSHLFHTIHQIHHHLRHHSQIQTQLKDILFKMVAKQPLACANITHAPRGRQRRLPEDQTANRLAERLRSIEGFERGPNEAEGGAEEERRKEVDHVSAEAEAAGAEGEVWVSWVD